MLLIGLEAFIPLRAPLAVGHRVATVGYGRLEAGGWYLVRRVNRHYDLRQVAPGAGAALVAVRSIRVSPYAREPGVVYFAGHDANKASAHNTARIYRAGIAAAMGTTPR